ncbi:MAG: gamma-glutamyl-gamma-aminobutyrate hydrolase family protein [Ignavibacteriales bacterium]|nr:gamma-glutamyl-gamma-aminobutyrate hydrolase family protein [Ignavibacteriales bacterium]
MIAVTDTITSEDKFNSYIQWLTSVNSGLKWIKLSYLLENIKDIDKCSGLLITGGGDVNPSLYRCPKGHPKIRGVDCKRDDFEKHLIDKAMRRNLPLLGICRGMQLVNVHFGGTLIPDVEDAGYHSHRSKGEIVNRHNVTIENDTSLMKIIGAKIGNINSSHHQAADKPGDGLVVTTRSDDGIIEAMELKDGYNNQFFQLIQWHPERMVKEESFFSGNILKEFLNQASNYFS